MSGKYGQFLVEGTEDYNNYYTKYKERVDALTTLSIYTVDALEDKYPKIKGMLAISYPNVRIAVARYFNDVIKYKVWHNIVLTHKSKIIAHLIKWISLNQIISCVAKENEFDSLDDESKIILINGNYFLISSIINYIINEDIDTDSREILIDKTIGDLFYFIKTGGYDERMACLWFEKIV